jgi:hypothetical protein
MTISEYDNAYSVEAAEIGHKTFVITLLKKEIEAHLLKCESLNQGKKQLLDKEKEENVSSTPSDG